MNAYKSRESVAKGTAFQRLATMLQEYRAALGVAEVDKVLRKYPKATWDKHSEHAQLALDALQAKMKSPPQPPAGESAQIIFNEVPEREFTTPKAWTDEIQIGDEVLQAGQWWKVTRIGSDNTGPFIYYDKPGQLPIMGNNKDEGRIRPWQVRTARRDNIEFSELVPYVPAPPASVEPVTRIALAPEQIQGLHNTAQAARFKLGADRHNRRLGRDEKPERKDTRTGEQIMNDLVQAQTAVSIQQAQTVGVQTRDDMEKAVQIAYSMNGNAALPPATIKAVAYICWELGLSPNPAMGHMYCWKNKTKPGEPETWSVAVGKDGLINLARRDHQFILRESRLMTEEERAHHCDHPDDVGVMVGLINMAEAREQVELMRIAGLTFKTPQELFDMVAKWYPGRWRAKAYDYWDATKKQRVEVGDSIPNTWSKFQVGEKRALRTALKSLGLNSNVGRLPDLRSIGFDYDAEEGAWVNVEPAPALTPTATPAVTPADAMAAMEAEFTAQVATETATVEAVIEEGIEAVVEAPETPGESAQPEPTPAVTPRYSPSELKSKFDQAVNALISKWNKSDNPGRVQEVANIESLLLEFGDVCTVPEVRAFIGSLIGKQVSAAQAEILKSKILNSPEQARLEIADYLRVFGSVPSADEAFAKLGS